MATPERVPRMALVVAAIAASGCARTRSAPPPARDAAGEKIAAAGSTASAPARTGAGPVVVPPRARTLARSTRVTSSLRAPLPDATSARIYDLVPCGSDFCTGYSQMASGKSSSGFYRITTLGLMKDANGPPGTPGALVPSADPSKPAWWVYQTAYDRGSEESAAVRVGSSRSTPLFGMVNDDSDALRRVVQRAWAPADPPRGILLWSETSYGNEQIATGEVRSGSTRIIERMPRVKRSVLKLTTTVAGRWSTRTVARGAFVAASTKEFALVSGAHDKLEASWLRDDATVRKSASNATRRGTQFKPVAALLTEAGEILLAGRSFGPTAADLRLLTGGFDAKGKPLQLHEMSHGDAGYTGTFALFECGSRAWLVAGVWPGGRLGIELYSLADRKAAPELIWQADGTRERFGFEGFQTHCRDGRAAVAARLDARESSVVLVEWKTD